MKKILSLFLSLFIAFSAVAQRDVFWVHGFAANNSAWIPVITATEMNVASNYPARQFANCSAITYTPIDRIQAITNIDAAGAELRRAMKEKLSTGGVFSTTRAENTIAIAHSQGGFVTRWSADVSIPQTPGATRNFKGFVTFGTPHGGAGLASSRFNGNLDVFLNDACKRFGGGLIHQQLMNIQYGWLLESLGVPASVNDAVDGVKNNLCDKLFSKAPTSMPHTADFISQKVLGTILPSPSGRSAIDDPILDAYRLEAPQVSQLRNGPRDQDIIRMAFYGVEPPNQIFFKTINYFFNPSQAQPPFEATDSKEQITINKALQTRESLLNDAIGSSISATIERSHPSCGYCFNIFPIVCFYKRYVECPAHQNEAKRHDSDARALRDAVNWMDNVDQQWLGVIEALEQASNPITTCVCPLDGTVEVRSCEPWNNDINCYEEIVFGTPASIKDNDGVVVKESALDFPGKVPLSDEQARMPGSHHMQMRNDPNTKEKLRTLFDGGFHPYFQTF